MLQKSPIAYNKMGYNPYICIVCGNIEDNGWFDPCNYPYYSFSDRCDIVKARGIKCMDTDDDIFDGRHCITYDVCNKCFNKGPSIKDPFFNIKRTKAERTAYWTKK